MTSPHINLRRVACSQVSIELQQAAQSCLHLDQFTEQAVNIIRDGLGFPFVGVIFLDSERECARFHTGTGDWYSKKISYIYMSTNNIITWVIRTGQVRMADLASSFRNPLFPEACVQIVLPLKAQNGIFGALEIFSAKSADFEEAQETIPMFVLLTDQIALTCAKLIELE